MTYDEAVEQALCFGWIDGLQRRHDEHSARLRFSPRRQKSKWSAPNRERVERMTREGLMTEAGQAAIDRAKADGTWGDVEAPDAAPHRLPPHADRAPVRLPRLQRR